MVTWNNFGHSQTTYGTRAANGGPCFRDGKDLERGFPDERDGDVPPETHANGGGASDAYTTHKLYPRFCPTEARCA